MNRTLRLVSASACLLAVLFSCQVKEGGPILLTREAEVGEEYSGWVGREYYTGLSLQETEEYPEAGNYIYLQVNIPQPGRYYPWVLAALDRYDTTARRELKITVTPVRANSRSRVDSTFIDLSVTCAPEWMTGSRERRWLDFPDFGEYFLVVEGGGDMSRARIILDKVLLSSSPAYEPRGVAWLNDTVDVVLPPAWAFGVLYGGYTDQAQTRARIDSLLAAGLPVDAYWIDSWFWDFGGRGRGPGGYIDFRGDAEAFPDPKALWQYMAERQIKSGLWIWNAIQERGNEPVFRVFEERGYFDGVPYDNTDPWHNAGRNTRIGDIDFENPEAVVYWKQQLAPLFTAGLDFLKLDRSSAVPFMKAAFEATREMGAETEGRGFILAHLHSTYDPQGKRYPARWTGDAKIAWTQPGYPDLSRYAMGAYRENVAMIAHPRRSTYAAPFLTHDAGGYTYYGSDEQSDSLYMRWIQFAMLNPITTVFSAPENPTANLPYRFSGRALDNFRYYSHLKLRLFPYLYTYAHLNRETGRKIVQGEAAHPDQYLLGGELLVAPVVSRGALARDIRLPAGEWIDFHDHRRFAGDATIRYEAPLDRLPLLVRAGSIIPMRPYARNVASGSRDSLILQVYPGGAPEGRFSLWEDDGVSNEYRRGRVARTTFAYRRQGERLGITLGAAEGAYAGMPEQRSVDLEILWERTPTVVRLNGKPLPGDNWRYDAARQWLTVRLGTLAATRASEVEIR